jgi:hypothetical protein
MLTVIEGSAYPSIAAYLERRSISGLVTTQRVKSIGLQVRFTPVNRHWQAF